MTEVSSVFCAQNTLQSSLAFIVGYCPQTMQFDTTPVTHTYVECYSS